MKSVIFKISTMVVMLITIYILGYLLSNPEWHKAANQPPKSYFYPTNIYATQVIWVNDWYFLFKKNNSIYEYQIKSRSLKKIFSAQSNYQIQTFHINPKNKKLRILVQTHDNQCVYSFDENYNLLKKLVYPKYEYNIFGSDILCSSQINPINNLKEIATNIKIYSLKNTKSEIQPFKELQTNQTLIPQFCSFEKIILSTHPNLEPRVYIWNLNQEAPENIQIPKNLFSDSSLIKMSDNGEYMTFKGNNKELTIYNTDKQLINQMPIDSNVWILHSKFSVISIDSNNNKNFIVNNSINSKRKIHEISSTEKFTGINPSPNLINFALNSSTGELWILSIKPELNWKIINNNLLNKPPDIWAQN